MRRFAILALLALLPACNTIRGAGEDVAAVGSGVSRGAVATEDKLFGPDQQQSQSSEDLERQQRQHY
jgi:predicted small secreted protein